jgi:hypothetical protein
MKWGFAEDALEEYQIEEQRERDANSLLGRLLEALDPQPKWDPFSTRQESSRAKPVPVEKNERIPVSPPLAKPVQMEEGEQISVSPPAEPEQIEEGEQISVVPPPARSTQWQQNEGCTTLVVAVISAVILFIVFAFFLGFILGWNLAR